MERYNYFISEAAQDDIEGIAKYISENYYSQTALAIIKEIRAKIERISENPYIYEERDIFSNFYGYIRIAIVKNYNMFFAIDSEKKVVYVVRVAHFKMNLIQNFFDGIRD